MDAILKEQAIDTVYAESFALDTKEWDTWLDLYTEDATYWMPAWKNEQEQTTDPACEISLIYYGNRSGLEDRVFRLRTELSFASAPLFRTAHLNSNFRVSEGDNDEIIVNSSWQTNAYRLGKTLMSFGIQEHRLRKTDQGLKICYRKITLNNDIVDSVLDVYCI